MLEQLFQDIARCVGMGSQVEIHLSVQLTENNTVLIRKMNMEVTSVEEKEAARKAFVDAHKMMR